MGIGFDLGPPPPFGRVEHDWFGTRKLTGLQLGEIAREIDAQLDSQVNEQRDDWFTIEGDHEEFIVRLDGGHLSKPSRSDDDEYDRLTSLMLHIADRAGWIVVGPEGLVHGGFLECTKCGAKKFPYKCPRGCPRSDIVLHCTQSPPATPAAPKRTSLDAVREASTVVELSQALVELGHDPPLDDPDVLLALLIDEDWAQKALVAIERLGKEAFTKRASLLDARLRRIENLSDDEEIAKRAATLRRLP